MKKLTRADLKKVMGGTTEFEQNVDAENKQCVCKDGSTAGVKNCIHGEGYDACASYCQAHGGYEACRSY